MGAPESGMEAVGEPTAEALLTAFRTIKADERAKHETVLNYWLSIRGDKEFPPLHDLDPLEISDAGPSSILFELISGGQDAEIRHLGDALKEGVTVDRIIDAPSPSLLSSLARKLPIVAISRDFLSFEDSFTNAGGLTRCWVTLLPLSSCGSWVDYVYAFVSLDASGAKPANAPAPDDVADEPMELSVEDAVPEEAVVDNEATVAVEEAEASPDVAPSEPADREPALELLPEPVEGADETNQSDAEEPAEGSGPGFSKLLEGFANLAGFYGQGIKADPVVSVELDADGQQPAGQQESEPVAGEPAQEEAPAEPVADEAPDEPVAEEAPLELEEPAALEPLELDQLPDEQPADEAVESVEPEPLPEPVTAPEPEPQSTPAMEGSLQSKLTDVRTKADEARQAQLRATAALHEGLSAAYDFALDAETSPEEYLRLVEAQGMKIQLRAPMAPVVKLAFDGLADTATIAELETVLAWALKQELPRGTLGERIERAGGIDALLNEAARR